jgi:hypothetical protein
MIIVQAKEHGGARVFYDRKVECTMRVYHAFGLAHVVTTDGSYWRLILGPWCIAFGLRNNP